jgi:hypothetical protein
MFWTCGVGRPLHRRGKRWRPGATNMAMREPITPQEGTTVLTNYFVVIRCGPHQPCWSYDDLWLLDVTVEKWERLPMVDEGHRRAVLARHAAVVSGDHMYVSMWLRQSGVKGQAPLNSTTVTLVRCRRTRVTVRLLARRPPERSRAWRFRGLFRVCRSSELLYVMGTASHVRCVG